MPIKCGNNSRCREDTDQDQFGYARRNEREALCKVVTKDTVNNKDAEVRITKGKITEVSAAD